ncbi:MAG: hypothetical protein LKM32_00355 [Chiayiivirga sp.]|jgi:tetratricopeptide (TPR) repeat protein|uniref:tetratricopeptide repeat protein n=1 Tax=Chiayiivirga sp. TaxID=2041042 RepID=UPI0025B7ADB1|nr:hypothetical protein [Chiayiivirga sp.]MCI1711309.1 hypothetical protein [Chiayiivirga sp.]MCI1727888.1 hypothetical protein [Chiayiivirga sp.]
MKFAIARWCAPVVMLMLAGPPAWAQDGSDLPLPTAAEAYGAEDPLAVAPKRIDPTDSRAVKMLEQILQYDPENVNARIQNADLMIAKGQRQRGLDEYAYALRLAGADTKKQHTVHWNYGWALYRGGEVRGAISQWMKAEALHGGRPTWAPTTYAIGLWTAGEKALALDFYKSAVRSNPRRWGTSSGLDESIRTWDSEQRQTIKAVYDAWRETLGTGR